MIKIISLKGKNKILRFYDSALVRKLIKDIIKEKIYFRAFGKRKFNMKKDYIIIDIGANVGVFSVYAANLAKKGKVYAYEPITENFELLKYHKGLNKLFNLNINKLAVSDKEKEIKIFLSKKNKAAHSIYKEKLKEEEKEDAKDYETINCISLKQVFDKNNIKRCNFLKIDCEGEEYKILKALPKEYFEKIDKIALEYHQVPGESCWELADYLNNLGFFIGIYHWRKNFGMLYAYKKALKI